MHMPQHILNRGVRAMLPTLHLETDGQNLMPDNVRNTVPSVRELVYI